MQQEERQERPAGERPGQQQRVERAGPIQHETEKPSLAEIGPANGLVTP